MWKYNRTISPDELYHHKYIAKIGYGPSARYFYTQEQLNAYRKALSSKDELNNAYNVSQEHRGKVQFLTSDFRDNTNKGTKTKRREKAIKNNLEVLENRAKAEPPCYVSTDSVFGYSANDESGAYSLPCPYCGGKPRH